MCRARSRGRAEREFPSICRAFLALLNDGEKRAARSGEASTGKDAPPWPRCLTPGGLGPSPTQKEAALVGSFPPSSVRLLVWQVGVLEMPRRWHEPSSRPGGTADQECRGWQEGRALSTRRWTCPQSPRHLGLTPPSWLLLGSSKTHSRPRPLAAAHSLASLGEALACTWPEFQPRPVAQAWRGGPAQPEPQAHIPLLTGSPEPQQMPTEAPAPQPVPNKRFGRLWSWVPSKGLACVSGYRSSRGPCTHTDHRRGVLPRDPSARAWVPEGRDKLEGGSGDVRPPRLSRLQAVRGRARPAQRSVSPPQRRWPPGPGLAPNGHPTPRKDTLVAKPKSLSPTLGN